MLAQSAQAPHRWADGEALVWHDNWVSLLWLQELDAATIPTPKWLGLRVLTCVQGAGTD
jgi:hypothetical protein